MAEKSYRHLSTPDGTIPINEKPIEETNDASKDAPKDAPDDHEYPGTLSLVAIMTALYLAIFLVALVSLSISIHVCCVRKDHANKYRTFRIEPLSLQQFHVSPTTFMR